MLLQNDPKGVNLLRTGGFRKEIKTAVNLVFGASTFATIGSTYIVVALKADVLMRFF